MKHVELAPAPWWKFGHVWLVVSGPVVVVVASFITLYLAVTRPDPVVSEDYYQQGINDPYQAKPAPQIFLVMQLIYPLARKSYSRQQFLAP